MSDSAAKNVFEEWMAPFMDEEQQPESQSQQDNEDQLDLFAELERKNND